MDTLLRRKLQKLPQQEGEVWQGGSVCLRTWIVPPRGQPYRPWIVLWVNATQDLILSQGLESREPTPRQIWEGLVQAMQRPLIGKPHRPEEVQVRSHALAEFVGEALEPFAIRCVSGEDLGVFDHILGELEKTLRIEDPIPGHLEVPGVTPDQVASLFQAAAEFYRRAPWRYIDDSIPIAVQAEQWSPEPWYAVVMGHGGLTYGLGLHKSLELLERMYSGKLSDAEAGRRMEALSLSFGDITEMSFGDLDAIEQYGWEIAGPQAYPFLYRIDPHLSMRRPLPQEIDLTEACLRALPPFIEEQGAELRHESPVREVSVPLSSGTMVLRLTPVKVRPPFAPGSPRRSSRRIPSRRRRTN